MEKHQRKRQYISAVILLLAFAAGFCFHNVGAKAAKKGIVTASSLNVRTGPGTNYDILKSGNKNVSLKKNTSVTIQSEKKGWYYISFTFDKKTKKGYVSADYIKKEKTQENSSNTAASGFKIPAEVTASSLNVRSQAGTDKKALTDGGKNITLKKGTSVTVLKEKKVNKQGWYQVSFTYNKKNKTGYVAEDYVKLKLSSSLQAKGKIDASSPVKIRTGAGNNKGYLYVNKIKVTLKKGTALTITKEVSSDGKKWVKASFTYKNKKRTGYLPKDQTILTGVVKVKPSSNTSEEKKTGKATTVLKVRKGAGTNYDQLVDSEKQKVTLTAGQKVDILKTVKSGSQTWYQISFTHKGKKMSGYVSGQYITLDKDNSSQGNNTEKPPENEPEGPLSDEEFEESLKSNGFPESYKPYLRDLHKEHPHWKFKAYKTGLNWTDAIENEYEPGKNLIPNSKNLAWKSMDKGAYNWKTDKFIVFDGSSWVTVSKAGLSYYMDPRNFLTTSGIFQFEALNYEKDYQNLEGVENILKNTPLYKKSYTYTDDKTGKKKTTTYGQTFIDAAKISGVSPYHLASRVKQEIVTGVSSLSSVATGKMKGYEGYYNFYNIGATHSTKPNGAIINAMNYAKNGSSSALTNEKYLLPWNSPYKAIVGGASYIGVSYVARGQNTLYLQKFNVTPISTYSHQYMANVEAPAAEAVKTWGAYSKLEDIPVVFSIPVYNNMPSKLSEKPTDALNPNNWLKSLSVSGYSLTPTFNPEKNQQYDLIVENEVSKIKVSASAASAKASVSGTGSISLKVGNNKIKVSVRAENGSTRSYTINVVREA